MPFTNPVSFNYTAPLVENLDYFLWRGITGMNVERTPALANVSYTSTGGAPCYASTVAAASTMNFGFVGTIAQDATKIAVGWAMEIWVYRATTVANNVLALYFGGPNVCALRITSSNVSPTQQFNVVGRDDASIAVLNSNPTMPLSTWHKVRMEVRGTSQQMIVNNVTVATASGTTFTPGDVVLSLATATSSAFDLDWRWRGVKYEYLYI